MDGVFFRPFPFYACGMIATHLFRLLKKGLLSGMDLSSQRKRPFECASKVLTNAPRLRLWVVGFFMRFQAVPIIGFIQLLAILDPCDIQTKSRKIQ